MKDKFKMINDYNKKFIEDYFYSYLYIYIYQIDSICI